MMTVKTKHEGLPLNSRFLSTKADLSATHLLGTLRNSGFKLWSKFHMDTNETHSPVSTLQPRTYLSPAERTRERRLRLSDSEMPVRGYKSGRSERAPLIRCLTARSKGYRNRERKRRKHAGLKCFVSNIDRVRKQSEVSAQSRNQIKLKSQSRAIFN